MKITRISVYRIVMPLKFGGYTWAKGKTLVEADSTVVRLDTDDGLTGWGEFCPLGANYLPSYPEGARAGIGVLAPHLLGLDPTKIGALNGVMDRELRGHLYVKSPIDVAAHDILGKAAGLPVHALLGGRQVSAAPMYRSVGQGAPAEMAEVAEVHRRAGYRQFQLKVGCDPDDDIARIEAVHGALQPGELLLCDANTGWRRDEALKVARATAGLDYIFEQPCYRYADNLSVRRRAPHTFKLDETLQSVEDVQRAITDDACDVACIKISKMGGLSKSRFARDLLAANGIPMTVEDVWGGDIVTSALAHLALSTPPDALLNTTDLLAYNEVEFCRHELVVRDGTLDVGDAPGLGVEPDLDKLGEPVAVYQ